MKKKQSPQYDASMEMLSDDLCMRTANTEMRIEQEKKRVIGLKKKAEAAKKSYKRGGR